MEQPIDPVKAEASSDLNDVLALRHNVPFTRYWLKEPARKIEELTKILTNIELTARLSEMDRERKLGELSVWRRVAGKLDADEAGNRSILGLE